MVISLLTEPSKIRDMNDSLITLIPMVEPMVKLRDLRPISLCNVSYKVVTNFGSETQTGNGETSKPLSM